MCPYDCVGGTDDADDAVNMVGHHHPIVQFEFLPDRAGFTPFLSDDFSKGVQLHPAVYHTSK